MLSIAAGLRHQYEGSYHSDSQSVGGKCVTHDRYIDVVTNFYLQALSSTGMCLLSSVVLEISPEAVAMLMA